MLNFWLRLLVRRTTPRKTIYGCDSGRLGGRDSAFLTRYALANLGRFGNLYLHQFHRSDEDVLHDHPWSFVSLILAGGYIERTPSGARRKWPGMVLFRSARWVHRTELVAGEALTLIWVSRKWREWGFHTPAGWVPWREFFADKGC